MPGHNAAVLDHTFLESTQDKGYPAEFGSVLPGLLQFRTGGGVTLTTATGPKLAIPTDNNSSTAFGVTWVYTAAASATLSTNFVMPDEFAAGEQKWKVFVKARKVDASADENADLKLQAVLEWVIDGENPVTPRTVTATSVALGAAVAGSGAYAEYEIDIGAALEAAGKTIPRGASVWIHIGPNEQVGSADMILEVAGVRDRMWRHSCVTRANRE